MLTEGWHNFFFNFVLILTKYCDLKYKNLKYKTCNKFHSVAVNLLKALNTELLTYKWLLGKSIFYQKEGAHVLVYTRKKINQI